MPMLISICSLSSFRFGLFASDELFELVVTPIFSPETEQKTLLEHND
jgi:hypothetical protein